jgi:RNA binding exosome subunit
MDFRVFCHATESEEKVRKTLTFITGSEDIGVKKVQGFHGNPIIIMESSLSGKRLESLMENLKSSSIMKGLEEGFTDRVTEDCVLYIRFDKQRAFAGIIDTSSMTMSLHPS